jgi:hypothetical protein
MGRHINETAAGKAFHEERVRIANARYAKVLTLRNEGWRLKDIAKEMGVSVERARQMAAKGWRIDTFYRPENVAARERQEAKERAKRKRRDSLAVYLARVEREPQPSREERAIVRAHAEQQLWRAFVEPHGAWRRPIVGPYRPLHDWLDWRGSAGVTYRDVPGRLEPEWRASV